MSTTTVSDDSIPRRADNVETSPWISEDWLSLVVGLLIFALALGGLANTDLLGWGRHHRGLDRYWQGARPGGEILRRAWRLRLAG